MQPSPVRVSLVVLDYVASLGFCEMRKHRLFVCVLHRVKESVPWEVATSGCGTASFWPQAQGARR